MKIKNRLSLFFTVVSSVNLLIVMVLIYISFYNYLQADFFRRLRDRLNIATSYYIESDKQSPAGSAEIKEEYTGEDPGEVIQIYNSSNQTVMVPANDQIPVLDIVKEIREKAAIEYSDNERFIIGQIVKNESGDLVILVASKNPDRIRQLAQFIIFMIVIFVFSLVLIFSLGRWFSQKTLSPINKLIAQLQEINASNLDRRVKVKHENDEIGLLAQNFNKLLIKLEGAFELQKAFVANASHELRTPVTTIIGEAEISLKQERTPEEYQTIIRSMMAESEKLNDTISGLIDLAQVDINFSRAILVPIRIDDLIWELQEHWSKKLYPNALMVTMDNLSDNEDSLIIKANRALLLIALNNVIGNAFKFSSESQVKCILEIEGEGVKITVRDKGIGINPEYREKIFEAFFRSERSSGYTGSGIGLYVTQKIVQMLKGSIEAISLPNHGTSMILRFQNVISNDA